MVADLPCKYCESTSQSFGKVTEILPSAVVTTVEPDIFVGVELSLLLFVEVLLFVLVVLAVFVW